MFPRDEVPSSSTSRATVVAAYRSQSLGQPPLTCISEQCGCKNEGEFPSGVPASILRGGEEEHSCREEVFVVDDEPDSDEGGCGLSTMSLHFNSPILMDSIIIFNCILSDDTANPGTRFRNRSSALDSAHHHSRPSSISSDATLQPSPSELPKPHPHFFPDCQPGYETLPGGQRRKITHSDFSFSDLDDLYASRFFRGQEGEGLAPLEEEEGGGFGSISESSDEGDNLDHARESLSSIKQVKRDSVGVKKGKGVARAKQGSKNKEETGLTRKARMDSHDHHRTSDASTLPSVRVDRFWSSEFTTTSSLRGSSVSEYDTMWIMPLTESPTRIGLPSTYPRSKSEQGIHLKLPLGQFVESWNGDSLQSGHFGGQSECPG